MINAKLIGGLGNNMFQYSLGRILAEEKNYNLSVENIANLQKYFQISVKLRPIILLVVKC